MYTLLGYDLKLKLNHVVDWSDLKVDTLTTATGIVVSGKGYSHHQGQRTCI